ncbi:MAG: Maf family protein [Thermoanaerobaculia bacterium]
MRFVLASQSPRRRELLESVGLPFDVVPSHVPEVHATGESPDAYVTRLSRDKARPISASHPDRWVIAADTIVMLGNELLEKPADEADARRMLSLIAGRTHVVHTGVTLQCAERDYLDTRVAQSEVQMLPLTADEVAWYAATGEPLDKAGAYAVQGVGSMFIQSVNGSYTNVVGLPLALLFEMLKRAGIDALTLSRPTKVCS